ncbi:MAG: hypothetical protein IJV45_08285 [Prevotella sp.]|nr:hypothetical protein [Prevotella sp.]
MSNNQFSEARYRLDSPRVTGRRQQKTACPQCGRKHCFVRYVDTRNGCAYVGDECGRCDHEQSCGYHLKPSEYFHDHPWLKPSDGRPYVPVPPPRPKPLMPLPMTFVEQSMACESTFRKWFADICLSQLGLSEADVRRVTTDYCLGATLRGDVIYWQIDLRQRVRSGHIMRYGPDGHRRDYQSWVHSRLIAQRRLPLDFQLRQCFYGEHLLARRPDAQVCLVESEKTALLMAVLHPDAVWIASCGCKGLTAEKLCVLKGRRVAVFPDAGCYADWLRRMQQSEGVSYVVTDALEQYPPNTDLADLMEKHR